MAAREVLALNISVPRIEVPQTGDTYLFPRASSFGGNIGFSTDAAYDIGSGGVRARDIYYSGGIFGGGFGAGADANIGWQSRSQIQSPSNGVVAMMNTAGTSFTNLILGAVATARGIYLGAGTPEGATTAPVGSLFLRTDGGASTTLYVKESGAGNTGWVAK